MMGSKIRHALQDPRAAVTRFRRLVDPRAESDATIAGDAGEYWNASRDNPNIKDLSHWRGEGRWEGDEWTAIGERHVALFEDFVPLGGQREQPATRVMEWGPGGGSNVLAFSHRLPIETFYGVDISSANLEECARQCQNSDVRGFHPINFNAEDPESVTRDVAEPLDVFLSTAVYQHFPSKSYGRRVTSIASELLRPGGVALIQIRYSEGSRLFRAKRKAYKRDAIAFTSYDIPEFWSILSEAGLKPLAVHLEPATNYAFYFAVKPLT